MMMMAVVVIWIAMGIQQKSGSVAVVGVVGVVGIGHHRRRRRHCRAIVAQRGRFRQVLSWCSSFG